MLDLPMASHTRVKQLAWGPFCELWECKPRLDLNEVPTPRGSEDLFLDKKVSDRTSVVSAPQSLVY